MNNIVLSPISLNEMENLIKVAVKNAFDIYLVSQPKQNQQSKYGDIDWYRKTHPNNPAISTVYSNIYSGKIPKYLIYKPKGTKQVLFIKELVLQWIEDGFPTESQINAMKNGNSPK